MLLFVDWLVAGGKCFLALLMGSDWNAFVTFVQTVGHERGETVLGGVWRVT